MASSLAPTPPSPPHLRPTFSANPRSLHRCTLSLRTSPACFASNTAVAGGASLDWSQNADRISISKVPGEAQLQDEESFWGNLDADLHYWTRPLRPVQWYPGHIAKTEKELKNQLKLMDVVIEVRDARIPLATSHPQMDLWLGNRKKILVLNREDMISTADRNAWATFFAKQGIRVVFANGKLGMGTMKLGRLAKTLAAGVNVKRRAKGLLPRAVRAGIVGYPNVGKSSLINRLLKRRMCPAAPRPGITRVLKWVHFGKDLELLDSPGMLPMRISDQAAAIKLAICDDIGERSYDVADVAAILVQMLSRLPTVVLFLPCCPGPFSRPNRPKGAAAHFPTTVEFFPTPAATSRSRSIRHQGFFHRCNLSIFHSKREQINDHNRFHIRLFEATFELQGL